MNYSYFSKALDLVCLVFPFAEDFSDNEEVFPKEIAKWNSNDLMDKIEAGDDEGTSGNDKTQVLHSGGRSFFD